MLEVHPDIKKLVDTQTRYEIGLELVGEKVFPAYVEIPFKRRDAPTERSISNHGTTAAEFDPYSAFHTVQGPRTASAYYSEAVVS